MPKILMPIGDGVDPPASVVIPSWAIGAVLGSLAGGWLAHHLGRRLSYFLTSLGALSFSALLFLGLNPVHPTSTSLAC